MVRKLGRFLSVDPAGFDTDPEKTNPSHQPHFPDAYRIARKFSLWLRTQGMDRLVEIAKDLQIPALFGRKKTSPIDPSIRAELTELFKPHNEQLEAITGPLPMWDE